MCGIAGIIKSDGQPIEPHFLRSMVGCLRHRGPDAADVVSKEIAGFGHARLSIIDLAGGAQPMQNADRSLWITFNGEIFNYLELRESLIALGHQFATRSDTEVILHLYEQYGERCLDHMNGQWSFAIWDVRQRKLFAARDRLGIRPFFYTQTPDAFVFASEAKALFAYPGVRRELNLQALDQVFTFWVSLPPTTIFRHISELPPGHSLELKDGDVKVRRYWRLNYEPEGYSGPDYVERKTEELLDLLLDATRIRLRADVPVGAYLSGGLDSTLTTALIRRVHSGRLKSFSVSFSDADFDESVHQREASAFLNTEHEEIRCTYDHIADVFPDVVWHAESPLLRTAPAPLFLLSQLVRNHGFKVVMTGEGSDEILGGYDIYKEAKIRQFCARTPDSRFRPLLLKRLYPYMKNIQQQSPEYLKRFFHVGPSDLASPFFSHLPRWELTSRLKMFFSEDVKAELSGYDSMAELRAQLPSGFDALDRFCQAQYLESAYLLPGYILSSQGDRMAMAHAVEGRYPFLDYRVVQFAAKLPPVVKMKVLNEKYLLKRAAQGLIPHSIIQRHKQPYRAPDGKSFFHGKNLDYVNEFLSPESLTAMGVFNPAAVRALVDKFRVGRASAIKDDMALVGILSTAIVINKFIDNYRGREERCNQFANSYAGLL